MSEEQKQKLSEAHTGKSSWNKGKKTGPLSEEHKKKLSEAGRGKEHSDEWNKKVSESLKGRVLTEEHKKRIAEVQSDPEVKRKQSEARKRWWAKKRAEKENKLDSLVNNF